MTSAEQDANLGVTSAIVDSTLPSGGRGFRLAQYLDGVEVTGGYLSMLEARVKRGGPDADNAALALSRTHSYTS